MEVLEVLDGFSTSATLGYRPLVVRWADEGLPGGGNPGRWADGFLAGVRFFYFVMKQKVFLPDNNIILDIHPVD